MTDSMNFGPDWIRNLSSEGSTGSGASGGSRYQLADFRYGREEMLALFDRNSKPPVSLTNFKSLYSDTSLPPLALLPTSEEERVWQGRPTTISGPPRGRGGSLERGGRINRGRGGYQYGRASGYESGWGNGEQPDWSPRKEYNQRTMSVDNWRRARNSDDDDGWRNVSQGRSGLYEKWGRSTSWRGEGDSEERSGPPERGGRTNWHDINRATSSRRSWDNEDHLPEWATENPTEGGGTFDERGAFHGSDDELEGRPPNKREMGLQKSTSQQHISTKSQQPFVSSSKSAMSLTNRTEEINKDSKDPPKEVDDGTKSNKETSIVTERKKSVPNIPEKVDREIIIQERAKSEGPPKPSEKQPVVVANGPVQDVQRNDEPDFERLQEDFVLKLMVDEEPPKQVSSNFDVGGLQPPPNLGAPVHDKWFYQDPQGQMQGPFSNIEMAEWYKAGYFSNQLKVRRQCDERFFLLGELITMCSGTNPFQSGIRFPTLKNDVTKMPDPDILQFQYLSQMAAYKQAQARIVAEPWSAMTLQQQELAAQRLIMQQQQVPQEIPFIQQPPSNNPLMHMINQMQQANKLPTQGLVDKQPQNISSIDPHLQLHMGNILSLQNRIPPSSGISNHLQTGLPSNLPGSLPPESLSTSMPSLQSNPLNAGGMSLPGIQSNIPANMGGGINIPRPTSHGSVDQINAGQDNDPISNLLKQLQQKQQSQQVDSLWQQNQFSVPNSAPPPQQWQPQQEIPMSMWDIQQNNTVSPSSIQSENKQLQPQKQKNEKEKEQLQQQQQHIKDETSGKELKKKKEQEEKQAKKEAEEKRKQEQKKHEADKKAAEEKKKKEEEKVKKELEKAKKEAEEKRLRELEEKRRLKEQRKAEEEARKKSEESKKLEEERLRREAKEAEVRRQTEERRLQQEQIRTAKAAPWSQPNSTLGMSLADIQKAEKEKRAQEAVLQMQRLQEKEYQQQQQQQEKPTGIQLSWAKKPVEPRKVKSLAEIQAEEQERLAKQAAESRLQKEKEVTPIANNTSSIWNSQSLTWASASATNSQWSSLNSSGGFWDDSSHKSTASKPSTVSKSNSTNSVNVTAAQKQQQQAQKQPANKVKTKKEDSSKVNHNNNNNAPSSDEFTNWCYKTLSSITTSVDIPTFVTFLRDIESALDVREYCKEYLGESTATQQFATNFLEKRRSFKPKNNAHKDDMCSPAPAITPSLQHSTDFQEVKGKNKKNKKSKMLKVDSRILGFNVTSAPDRINVGDRDYGDNS